MYKINVLDSSVYNRISAGEVVERPSSVVKELVENCIDAGASDITVKIYDGGIQNITVIDNGGGIAKEYVLTAFLPHATSKISEIDDLDSISTLGFRGEALASISSVSKIDIKTKTIDSEVGYKMQSVGGNITFEGVCSCANGTSISVSDLFFNTPARAKFLKKPKQEENEITSVIQQIIFANSNVSIKYIVDDSVKIHSLGEGLENCIENVYGKEIVKHLRKVSYEKNNAKINGFVSVPDCTRSSRNFQTIIVNGRYIVNQTISTAVMQAFGNLLMKRSYPIFVLNILIPFEEIDINVHPNKTEVRFLNTQQIFSLVYHAVQNAILGTQTPHTESGVVRSTFSDFLGVKSVNNKAVGEEKKDFQLGFDEKKTEVKTQSFDELIKKVESITAQKNDDKYLEKDDIPYNTFELCQQFNAKSDAVADISVNYVDDLRDSENNIERIEREFLPKNEVDENGFEQYNINVVGQLFDTYIIVSKDDSVFIIDQHAAHERIIYDKLVSDYNSKNSASQGLFLPYVLNLENNEFDFILENLSAFRSFGFDIKEGDGLTFEVNAVPVLLAEMDVDLFFKNLFDAAIVDFKVTDGLIDKLSQVACKSAIKGGYGLNKDEIKYFISLFINEKMQLKCPHGRPIVLEFSKTDLEKKFKRIV